MNDSKQIEQRKSLETLLLRYNPQSQAEICKNRDKCFHGDFPSLSAICDKYGTKAAEMWLIPQLYDLSEFCGVKGKLSKEQLSELANLIADEYGDMKISELMLFFRNFKKGKYGRFYGTVDPIEIMIALLSFAEERNEEIEKWSRKISLQRYENQKKFAVTYEEYERAKNKN